MDMAAPNMQLRDPIMYRIKHAHHHRTGDAWCIYPMYDFAHGQSDSIEKITHSICTLEFVSHRPLYDWFIEKLEIFPSHQYEFARLNLNYTVMSKRKLLQLVNEGHVTGWDDPRMPTISGLRRRGYTPESIRMFAERIGVQKRDNLIDVSLLEFCVREHLNKIALRRMVVFDPLKVVLTNYPDKEEVVEERRQSGRSGDDTLGTSRSAGSCISSGRILWRIRRRNSSGLSPGQKVRLKSAYIIQCDEVVKDGTGISRSCGVPICRKARAAGRRPI